MSQENRVKVRKNGPLLCTGTIEVRNADGALLDSGDDIALCRCGASANKPFCDGSHRAAGFEDAGMLAGVASDELEGEGPLVVSVRANAMLIAKGPMTLVSADGAIAATRNKAAFCRCGASANKPFCDGSHKTCGFEG
ncbi:MAG TPA: CDGSH iron-sulfur domain-containing protein [Gammaproteobacteria bacterium]|nr:CDGSH iron-sulfur domain-containing protein [Gammaproteobacteria bacterium]